MALKNFTVTEKIELTHDVYEIHFEAESPIDMDYGQFVTFILPGIGGRSYSVLESVWNTIKLIIKKVELSDSGRWGSIFICDSQVWDILQWVGPAGHFVLQRNDKNKLFIGTGTGLVPLYNQILWVHELDINCEMKMLFWVRRENDLFYIDELNALAEKDNFSYEVYTSREKVWGHHEGYVTKFLTKENVENFWEFYICGMPAMVDACVEKLTELWIDKESIFSEKYT